MIIPASSIVTAWLIDQDKKQAFLAVQDLKKVASAIKQSKKVREVLLSPRLDSDAKAQILGKAELSKITIRFIKWLDKKLEWKNLPLFIREAERFVSKSGGARLARAYSAVEMTDKEKNELISNLSKASGKVVQLQTEVRPNIIGGLVIDFLGKRYDLSLRGRLNQMNKSVNNIKIV